VSTLTRRPVSLRTVFGAFLPRSRGMSSKVGQAPKASTSGLSASRSSSPLHALQRMPFGFRRPPRALGTTCASEPLSGVSGVPQPRQRGTLAAEASPKAIARCDAVFIDVFLLK
jgi:hypothetical protein